MNPRFLMITIAFAAVAALPIIVCANRQVQAQSRLEAARISHAQALLDVQEINDLRSRHQVVNAAQRPPQDVIAQVNTVLAEVGIPANRLKSLTPESDSAVNPSSASSTPGGVQYKRQLLRLTLENLSVQEIGAFLAQWKISQQVWTPIRIELTHVRKQNDNRYDATILLSAIYVASPPPPTAAPAASKT